jgi:hypothetical protein
MTSGLVVEQADRASAATRVREVMSLDMDLFSLGTTTAQTQRIVPPLTA